MGHGIAERVLAGGHTVTVYNRTTSKADSLRAKGATVAPTPAAAVRDAEVVLTMLADDAAVEQVVFESDGILAGMRPGAIHISSSTISVALAQRLGAVGPVFEVIGQRTYRVGSDPWVANLFKITGNFMIAAAIETMAEAFALVRKAGVDAQLFRELFTTSLFNAPIYLNYSDLVAREGDETVGFAAPLMLKDVRLALAALREVIRTRFAPKRPSPRPLIVWSMPSP